MRESDVQQQLAVLGRAYIDFGLSHPALFELMFAPSELHADDPELIAAQQQTRALTTPASRLAGIDTTPSDIPELVLISWAFVHGLVVLARDGALLTAATPQPNTATELTNTLTDLFTQYVGVHLRGGDQSSSRSYNGEQPPRDFSARS